MDCPTCGTSLPDDASRCFACGRVFGEDNRCPHCHAIAGVLGVGATVVCAACRKPRTMLPGTVVLGGSTAPVAPAATALVGRRAAGAGLRIGGGLAIGFGVFAAAVAFAVLPGALGLLFAMALGVAGVGGGAAALRAGARQGQEADKARVRDREHRILDLASGSGGDLTVTEVAQALGCSLAEADAALTAMADGSRVTVEVDPNGLVHYVFRELAAETPAARIRVDPFAALEGSSESEARVDVAESDVAESDVAESDVAESDARAAAARGRPAPE